jgi:hypothetical protein
MLGEVMTGEDPRALAFAERLAESGTRFLIVGGGAVRFHAPERRDPKDLDIFVEPTMAAVDQLNAIMHALGAARRVATPDALARPTLGFPVEGPDRRRWGVDVFLKVAGFEFPEHWAAGHEAALAGSAVGVRVASIATMKQWLRHALTMEPSRANDIMADLELLERAEQQREA